MARPSLSQTPPLGGFSAVIGENRIVERTDCVLTSIAVPRGGENAVHAALKDCWGLTPPSATRSVTSGDLRLVSMTADQMLLIGRGDGNVFETDVRTRLQAVAYTTDQTGAWVCLEISGPATAAAMERICPIDLAPERFPVDASARTVMEHVGVLIIRLGADHFLLFSASSSADSFCHAVTVSFTNVTDRSVSG